MFLYESHDSQSREEYGSGTKRGGHIPGLSSPPYADVADQSHSPSLEGYTYHLPADQAFHEFAS